jgi:PGF-pre-PGF domain-containing protein
MGKRVALFTLLVLVLVLQPGYSGETQIDEIVIQAVGYQEHTPVLVTLGNSPDKLKGVASIMATNVKLKRLHGNVYTAKISSNELESLLKDPNVLEIKEDPIFELQLADSVPLINATLVHSFSNATINITGLDQTVCIIDSGINETHPGVAGRVVAEKCFCDVTDLGSGGCCSDNTNNANDAADDHSHGTHVAGIAIGNGSEILGVAPEGRLVAVKVTNKSGSALFSDITEAVEFCRLNATKYNISVISMSLGGGSYTTACDSQYTSLGPQIDNAWAENVSVVASTGNSGSKTAISSPACIAKTIAVSASTDLDAVWSSSNRNNLTEIFAPGQSIVSLNYLGGTSSKSGTSMAAPHVAGAILLLQQYKHMVENMNVSASDINITLTTYNSSIDDSSGTGRYFPRLNLLQAFKNIDTKVPLLPHGNTSVELLYIYNNITFQFNATDFLLDSLWIEGNWSGSLKNYTVARKDASANKSGEMYNFTINNASYSAGQRFSWRAHANDSAGNSNSTLFLTETILTGGPRVTVNSPSNQTYSNNTFYLFNITALDESDLTFNCNIFFDGVINQTNSTTNNGTATNFTIYNIPDGVHTWFASCNDTASITGNSSVRSIVVDTSFPTFNTHLFNNSLLLGNKQNVSINVTDTNLEYVNFTFDRYVYQLFRNYTASYFVHNFTTYINGTTNYTIYMKDKAGNINSTATSFNANDSVTGPRIVNVNYTFSLTNGSTQYIKSYIVNALNVSKAIINFNGSNFTMYNNSHYNYTYNFSASTCGPTTFTIWSNDSAKQASIFTGKYNVTSCCGNLFCETGESSSNCSSDCNTTSSSSSSSSSSASTSGGGGGSGGSSATANPKAKTVSFSSADPANPIAFSVSSSEIAVNNLVISVVDAIGEGSVTVKKYDSQPEAVVTPAGTVYQFFSIDLINLTDAQVGSAAFSFDVKKSWFEDHKTDKDTVVMQRFSNNTKTWTKLETTYELEHPASYSYSTITPGFSYFTITADKISSNKNSTRDSSEDIEEIATIHQNETAELGSEVAQFAAEVVEEVGWFRIIVIGLVVMLSTLGLILFFARTREEEENV